MKIYDGNINDSTNFASNSFLQVNSCGMVTKNNGDSLTIRRQGRMDYHIVYITGGVCDVEYDGKKERISKGGFVIYPPDMPQKYVDYKDTEKLWLHFGGYGALEALNEAGLGFGVFECRYSLYVRETFIRLINEHNKNIKISDEKGILLLLIYTLGKQVNNIDNASDKIDESISFIITHYTENFAIETLAEMCSLSVSRFMYLFKQKTGISPNLYRQKLRISNSQRLLADSNLQIGEVARICGYDDPLYFSRIFKKSTGLSPMDYRKINMIEPTKNM